LKNIRYLEKIYETSVLHSARVEILYLLQFLWCIEQRIITENILLGQRIYDLDEMRDITEPLLLVVFPNIKIEKMEEE